MSAAIGKSLVSSSDVLVSLCMRVCVSVCLYVCVFGAVETKAQAASADTFKHRLEQLDDMEEVSVCV